MILITKTIISYESIKEKTKELARTLTRELKGEEPHLLWVADGARNFYELLREELKEEISFSESSVRIKSYEGLRSTGKYRLEGTIKGIKGKTVITIEDIIDGGGTMKYLVNEIKKEEPKRIITTTLLHKRRKGTKEHLSKGVFDPDYALFSIPEEFVIGFGLDLDEKARKLRNIYAVDPEKAEKYLRTIRTIEKNKYSITSQ